MAPELVAGAALKGWVSASMARGVGGVSTPDLVRNTPSFLPVPPWAYLSGGK